GERPKLGPVATGLGEVFHYVLSGTAADVTELRTLQDWVVRPKLRTVKGTAEINSWGGYEKQYQIRIDPNKLDRHKLTFDEVMDAVHKGNRNVGGGNVRRQSQMLLVQGLGRATSAEEVGDIVITAKGGVPIRVADVADVTIGHEIRRGAVTADGKGEVVLGLGFMLMGENSHRVTAAMKKSLDEIKTALPANVRVQTVYDRTELVDFVIQTVRNNLLEAGLLVVAVLFLFLGNLRAAAIVALAIPLSMLFAFAGMLRFGIAASLLSLGAIDFGMIVDSSVVMVENCVRHIAHGDLAMKSKLDMVREAAVEVRKPTLFGELIIMIVYLPILTLEGVEGKLFRPMALTIIFALAGSMILSMTLMPVLASLLLPKRSAEREPLLMRLAHALYRPVLDFSMRHKVAVLALAVLVLVVAFGGIAPNLGVEFVPTLSEGALEINVVRLADTPIERSIEENTRIEQAILRACPKEVNHVWSRIGSAEVATDPMGIELTDIFVTLKPRRQWRAGKTQADITDEIQDELRLFLGPRFSYTQPIKARLDEMTAGVKAALAVKVFGDDFNVLKTKAKAVEKLLEALPGSKDVLVEPVGGLPILQIKVKQDVIARHGVPAKTVLDLIESLGGMHVGEVVEGQFRFPLVIRLPEEFRGSLAHREDPKKAIEELPVITAKGERLPLGRLADVVVVEDSPSTITREWGRRRITITCNVDERQRDLGGFVAEAQKNITAQTLGLTGRYHLEWGGQLENLERAERRLEIMVPLALALIFTLLYLTYGRLSDVLVVFVAVPLACVGGVLGL
ncbi:MAG TPA: CusA/CzcA family heavy metal efflux RND transporter, partial [Pirellulales bacterium]|nr:CusA/CzcA family heavy metal efflux RND transporter [Pirellulales bacterium]